MASGHRWAGAVAIQVEIQADGFGPARLATDSDQSLHGDSIELSFVINERDCASGQAPTDRDVVPFVTETEEAVSIVVLVERVEGDATCPEKSLVPSHDHPRIAARVAAVARRTRVSAPNSRPRRSRGLTRASCFTFGLYDRAGLTRSTGASPADAASEAPENTDR